MDLTSHQKEKLLELITLINNKTPYINLIGSAGVGKTTLISKLLVNKELIPNIKTVLIATPTHKALEVIKDKIENNNLITINKEFKTIQKHLNVVQVFDTEGKTLFKRNVLKKINNYDLIIIDESSMIDSYLHKEITENKHYNTIIIFVSDIKQLNPVGEIISEIYNQNYPEVKLTEIVRQGKGNPIIELSNNINSFKTKNITNYNITSKEGIIYEKNLNKIINILAKVNGSNEYKYLAWTNVKVRYINNKVRSIIYNNPNPDIIYPNETLILRNPLDNINTNSEVKVLDITKGHSDSLIEYIKNTLFKYLVFDTSRIKIHSKSKFPDIFNELKKLPSFSLYYCTIKKTNSKSNITETMLVLNPEDDKKWNAMKKLLIEHLKPKKEWGMIDKINNLFTKYNYNHALTIHTSQGSTFKNVFIDKQDILRNNNKSELDKLIYTAITRASHSCIIYNN